MRYEDSSNPILQSRTFERLAVSTDGVMTVDGVVKKSALSLGLLICAAAFTWTRSYASLDAVLGKTLLFSILAMVTVFGTYLKPTIAKITVPLYAILEGMVIGAFSLIAERYCPGVVIQAAMGTFGVLGGMLILYKSGLIKVNNRFASVLCLATLGVSFIYLANLLVPAFGGKGFAFIQGSSSTSIVFSVIVCIIASLNFLVDFEFIVRSAKERFPKNMEWVATLGLLVTLVWVYMEILRLLMKLRSRD